MAQTPLELLTVIAAPALITNASSLLVLSSSNRFARAVDRARAIATGLGKHDQPEHVRIALLKEQKVATQRTHTLVQALTCFYLAIGAFSFGTFAGLIGIGIERLGYPEAERLLTDISLGVVTIGILSITTGSAMLVHESRMALRGLAIEESSYR
jgi:hypothetical protein